MGYSDDPRDIRVDFFKDSGKWYTTEAVKWLAPWFGREHQHPYDVTRPSYVWALIHHSFAISLRNHLGDRLSNMDAVCIKPYHEWSHPIMLKAGKWNDLELYPDLKERNR